VERALSRSEEIAAARARVAQADARVTQANAASLPQLSANLTYNRAIYSQFSALAGFAGADTNSIPSAFDTTLPARARYDTLSSLLMADFMAGLAKGLPFGRANTYVSLVQVSQPLFAGGRISAARAMARHGQAASQHQLAETEADMVLQVRVAYLNVVLAQRLRAIAVDARRIAAEHLDQVQLFRQAGTASEFDLLRARVDLENREPGVVQAENLARVAMLELKRLTNLPTEAPVTLTSTFDTRPVEVDEAALANLIAERPALLAAREMVALRRAGLTSARGEWFPTLAAQANLAFYAYPSTVAPPGFSQWRKDWSLALAVSWPLFDGFARNGRVSEASAALSEATSQQAMLEEGMRVELSQAVGDYHTQVAQLRARQETSRLAQEAHDLADLRYRNGLATQLEVSDAALVLDQARVNEVQALSDYVKALARLERLGGGRLTLLREAQP
jgi:outer membrane protein TolC